MKLAILLLAMTLTGCGNFVRAYGDPIELARKDCAKIGYYGPAYMQCVDRTAQQIRAQRSAERAAANSAPVYNNPAPEINFAPPPQIQYQQNRTITCTPRLGGRIDCS